MRARLSLTSTTGAEPGASDHEKSRPSNRGMPTVWKNPGEVYSKIAVVAACSSPDDETGPYQARSSGTVPKYRAIPTDVTPGRSLTRPSSSRPQSLRSRFDADGLADDVGNASEHPLPIPIPEHGDGAALSLKRRLFRSEEPAEQFGDILDTGEAVV
jgi:hypothetical protein